MLVRRTHVLNGRLVGVSDMPVLSSTSAYYVQCHFKGGEVAPTALATAVATAKPLKNNSELEAKIQDLQNRLSEVEPKDGDFSDLGGPVVRGYFRVPAGL